MSAIIEHNWRLEGSLAEIQQRAVLDAIDRELARLDGDYSHNVLRLAEAYAWLSGTARRAD